MRSSASRKLSVWMMRYVIRIYGTGEDSSGLVSSLVAVTV
jgi:hypothetical protein